MTKINYLDITPELEEKYYSGLQSMDRFIISRIRFKNAMLSKKRRTAVTNRSLIPQCVVLWNNLTSLQKTAWKTADQHPQQHGFRTFVADQAQRIQLSLSGVATPSQYHQDLVGQFLIASPASELKVIQPHPSSYWISQKVAGRKGVYQPVEVSESFSLPLKITISYKSDLVSAGAGSFVRFYASIRHLYQGQNLNHDEIIEIPLSTAWTSQDKTVSSLLGVAVSYVLYIHLYNVTGTLLIDNVKVEHSSANWARDTYCKKIEESFSRGFYQVPQHWASVTLPVGASYKSIYGGS